MTADDCRIWRERIGALVLGQLDADERTATEAHLEGCPDCRAEAEALSPMAAMLSRADPDRLSPPRPPRRISAIGSPGGSRPSAAPRAGGALRLGCGLGAAAAAATAAVLLAISLTGSTPGPAAEPRDRRLPAGFPKGVSVEASLESRAWGSDVSVRVRGFRPGTLCTVWLRRSRRDEGPGGLVPLRLRGRERRGRAELRPGSARRDRDRPAGRLPDLRRAHQLQRPGLRPGAKLAGEEEEGRRARAGAASPLHPDLR